MRRGGGGFEPVFRAFLSLPRKKTTPLPSEKMFQPKGNGAVVMWWMWIFPPPLESSKKGQTQLVEGRGRFYGVRCSPRRVVLVGPLITWVKGVVVVNFFRLCVSRVTGLTVRRWCRSSVPCAPAPSRSGASRTTGRRWPSDRRAAATPPPPRRRTRRPRPTG